MRLNRRNVLVIGLVFLSPYIALAGDPVAEANSEDPVQDAFRAIPYFANEGVKGYRVYPGPNRELFYSLGLNPGDLLSEFNGQPITDIKLFFEFLELLADRELVRLAVGELGESEIIEIQIPQDK